MSIRSILFGAMLFLAPFGAYAAPAAGVGDSLAVGVAQTLHIPSYAKVGMSSCWILRHAPRAHFDRMVISSGTNDPPGSCTAALRAAVSADHVVWVLPVNGARSRVLTVAAAHGDKVCSYVPGRRTWPHPESYKPLSDCVTRAWS